MVGKKAVAALLVVLCALLPLQGARGMIALYTARELVLESGFKEALARFEAEGPDAYDELLTAFETIAKDHGGETGQQSARYALYIQSWMSLRTAAQRLTTVEAAAFPRLRWLTEAVWSALDWTRAQAGKRSEQMAAAAGSVRDHFALLGGALDAGGEQAALERLTETMARGARPEPEGLRDAWEALRNGLSGLAALEASGFSQAEGLLDLLAPLAGALDRERLLAEGESRLQALWQESDRGIEAAAPNYAGDK